ncbi:MAG: antifreeze protein [Rhodobacteraceae bacterium]|nr:antifreeze protein [Paracoccaceae bacterium]
MSPTSQDDAREGRILFDVTVTGAQFVAMATEAHMVIAYRVLGFMGLWPLPIGENAQMILEKPAAIAQSLEAMVRAGFRGERPDRVLLAALAPVRERTRDNAARLAQLSPWA